MWEQHYYCQWDSSTDIAVVYCLDSWDWIWTGEEDFEKMNVDIFAFSQGYVSTPSTFLVDRREE
jgi:hypothetical protein